MRKIESVPTVTELLFEGSHEEINNETLRNSVQTKGTYGEMPATRPLQHFEFIDEVTSIFNKNVGSLIQEPLYVTKSSSKRIKLPGQPEIPAKEPCPIDRFVFERVATRLSTEIKVKDSQDVGYSPSIGISYNDRGIAVCMGVNVWVCSNMSIFGGKLWSTYGQGKVDYNNLINVIEDQTKQWEQSFDNDMNSIKKLKEHTIDKDTQRQWSAQILEKAIKANSKGFSAHKDLILNGAQTSRLVEQVCQTRDKNQLTTESTDMSAWDFVNAGTDYLKTNTQDLVSLYPTIEKFNSHVLELVN